MTGVGVLFTRDTNQNIPHAQSVVTIETHSLKKTNFRPILEMLQFGHCWIIYALAEWLLERFRDYFHQSLLRPQFSRQRLDIYFPRASMFPQLNLLLSHQTSRQMQQSVTSQRRLCHRGVYITVHLCVTLKNIVQIWNIPKIFLKTNRSPKPLHQNCAILTLAGLIHIGPHLHKVEELGNISIYYITLEKWGECLKKCPTEQCWPSWSVFQYDCVLNLCTCSSSAQNGLKLHSGKGVGPLLVSPIFVHT